MPYPIDDIMERASAALGERDYLGCEALCLEALTLARGQQRWAEYARILLPLQEARRQRRMIAAGGVIRLGTSDLQSPADSWLDQVQSGCIVVTRPHTDREAAALHDAARRRRLHIEVLFADNVGEADTWRLRSFKGPAVTCEVAAPPVAWRDRWLTAGECPATDGGGNASGSATPADWFLDASEALGDAALEQADPSEVEALEPLLAVAPDHEILHQRLAAAARERRGTGAGR